MAATLAWTTVPLPFHARGPRSRHLGGLGVVVVLLLLTLQVQVHGRSDEAGGHAAHPTASASAARTSSEPRLAPDVVTRITHDVRPVASPGAGTLELGDRSYTARFDTSGFTYTPVAPPPPSPWP